MDSLYQSDYMIERSVRKDTVAEVEDVAGPTFCAVKNPSDFSLD